MMNQYLTIFFVLIYGIVNAQLAVVKSVNQLCGENLGAIEVKILETENLNSFYWEDGDYPINRESLEVGTYYLHLTDRFGCSEELQIEVSEVTGLVVNHTLSTDPLLCKNTLSVSVHDTDGNTIQKEALNILWDDGRTDEMERIFYNDILWQACLEVTLKTDPSCVRSSVCIDVPASSNCTLKGDAKVIVNELYNDENQGIEFVELVVIGDKVCGSTYDLRGHIIDDNNGELIQANSLIFEANSNILGINEGYLRFSGNEQWRNVKNGTILLITKNINELNLSYDPHDTNNDHVFILNGSESSLFDPYDHTWDAEKSQYAYVGNKKDVINTEIEISNGPDGFQTRHADGSFDHGISGGRNSFSVENSFDLWITDHSMSKIHFFLQDKNYNLKTSYLWIEGDNEISPGIMNSVENQEIVDLLMPCDASNVEPTQIGNRAFQHKELNSIRVYPNPYALSFHMAIQSHMAGSASLTIHSVNGRLIHEQDLDLRQGLNENVQHPERTISSGAYVLTITFPDGEKRSKQLIHISN